MALDRRVAFVSAEHRLGAAYPLASRAWCPWVSHATTVLEWIDADGMRTRVRGVDGGRPFERPPRRWHLYGAGTAYGESYAHPHRIREHCWFFLALRPPLPLAGLAFAAFDDPEDRLLAHGRTLFAVQARGEPHARAQLAGLAWAAVGEALTAMRGVGDGSPRRPWVVRGTPPPEDTLLARLDALVAPRLARPPSVGELAERLGCSSSTLAHRLRAEGGTSVLARVRWLRVREARRRLALGEAPKAVAAALGFSTPAWFARVFQAVAGCTPHAYQGQSRANAGARGR